MTRVKTTKGQAVRTPTRPRVVPLHPDRGARRDRKRSHADGAPGLKSTRLALQNEGRAAAVAAGRRVRLNVDERRAELLELALDLFAKNAYEDMSIDGLAEAAGISKGLLYHYFGSKRELYVETLRMASHRLRRLTEPDPTLPPAARLRAAVDTHLRYIQEHGGVYAAVYGSGLAVAPEVRDILEEHREVIIRYFLQAMGVTEAWPLLRAALRAWVATVEGASLDWIAHPSIARDELRDLLVASYVAMIARTVEADPEASHVATSPDA